VVSNCAEVSDCGVEFSLVTVFWRKIVVVAGIETEIDVYAQALANVIRSYRVTWAVGTLEAVGTLKDFGASWQERVNVNWFCLWCLVVVTMDFCVAGRGNVGLDCGMVD